MQRTARDGDVVQRHAVTPADLRAELAALMAQDMQDAHALAPGPTPTFTPTRAVRRMRFPRPPATPRHARHLCHEENLKLAVARHHALAPDAARREYERRSLRGSRMSSVILARNDGSSDPDAAWRLEGARLAYSMCAERLTQCAEHHHEVAWMTTPAPDDVLAALTLPEAAETPREPIPIDASPPTPEVRTILTRAVLTAAPPHPAPGQGRNAPHHAA